MVQSLIGQCVHPITRQDTQTNGSDSSHRPVYSSRQRRGSRPDFSFLGIGGSNDQDASSLEARRENKQEREARKAEKERAARLKERERSMKEEHVDGGYLVTQGVYVGAEDFNKGIVRQLMVSGCSQFARGSSPLINYRSSVDWRPSGAG